MKHEIIITAQGHKGTLERLQNEFSSIKLWEAPDRDAALKAAAPRLRGLAHFGHSRVDGKLMDALPKLEIVSNFGVGVDQIDLDAAKKRDIIVTNTPDVLNDLRGRLRDGAGAEHVAQISAIRGLSALRSLADARTVPRSPHRSAARPWASSASDASARRSPSGRLASA